MYLTVLEVNQPFVPIHSFQLILAFTNKILKFNKTSQVFLELKFYSRRNLLIVNLLNVSLCVLESASRDGCQS